MERHGRSESKRTNRACVLSQCPNCRQPALRPLPPHGCHNLVVPSKILIRFCDCGVRDRDGRIRLQVGVVAEELQRLPGGTHSNLDAPSQALEGFRIAELRGFRGHIVTSAVIQPCNHIAPFVTAALCVNPVLSSGSLLLASSYPSPGGKQLLIRTAGKRVHFVSVRSRGRAGSSCDPPTGSSRPCAGGTPALPGGLHPLRSSHRGDNVAEASW